MKNITIIGAGTMGNGIAHVFAQNEFNVVLVDVNEENLQTALKTIEKNLQRMVKKELISIEDSALTLQRIQVSSNLKNGVQYADLVIEAATENEEIKLSLFKDLDQFCQKHTILASNTSSISITKIASVTQRPHQVIGMHFMNPVPVMVLVEVIKGYSTSNETFSKISQLSEQIGKTPVEVNDYPGFVANKILMPMINEAIITLHEGTAGVYEIDAVMKLGMAHPMGPLQLADFIGLDVCYSILKVLQDGYGNGKYAPCPLLVNMVNSGQLGIKTGEGFYTYSKGKKEAVVSSKFI